MAKSKKLIPKKGKNPTQLEVALVQTRRAMTDSMSSLDNLTQMVTENCRILGQLVVMFEILKDKGIITNDEIEQKFKDLEAQRKEAEAKKEADAKAEWDKERQALADKANDKDTDGDSKDPADSGVQSEESGNDEDNSGHGGRELSGEESNRTDS